MLDLVGLGVTCTGSLVVTSRSVETKSAISIELADQGVTGCANGDSNDSGQNREDDDWVSVWTGMRSYPRTIPAIES